MLFRPLVDSSSLPSISTKPKGPSYVFLRAVMPPWDSAIAPLGTKDPFGHYNLLVSTATAPLGIIADILKFGEWNISLSFVL